MNPILSIPGIQPAGKPRLPYSRFQVLLALDGNHLTPLLLSAALTHCVPLTDRLDILLVNPPKAPTSLLSVMLLRLEHSGIDYRLASTEGELGEQILEYLNRFLGITTVLVDRLTPLEQTIGPSLEHLRTKGYRFVPISEQIQME